jgi:hypothetical protein
MKTPLSQQKLDVVDQNFSCRVSFIYEVFPPSLILNEDSIIEAKEYQEPHLPNSQKAERRDNG